SDGCKPSCANEHAACLRPCPQLASVPVVGRHTADTCSVEQTLALRPDLVVLTAAFAGLTPGQDAGDSPLIQRLTAARVPVIVIDFFVNPLENTVPSLRALGYAVGEQARTDESIAFYEQHMKGILQRLHAARVPLIVIDVFVHPRVNSVPRRRALGYAVGEQARTDEFIAFYGQHMKGSAQRLADLPEGQRPPVFVHAHAGSTDCCN